MRFHVSLVCATLAVAAGAASSIAAGANFGTLRSTATGEGNGGDWQKVTVADDTGGGGDHQFTVTMGALPPPTRKRTATATLPFTVTQVSDLRLDHVAKTDGQKASGTVSMKVVRAAGKSAVVAKAKEKKSLPASSIGSVNFNQGLDAGSLATGNYELIVKIVYKSKKGGGWIDNFQFGTTPHTFTLTLTQ